MAYCLSTSDAAEILGVNESRVRQLIGNGQIDAEKIGGRWLVDDVSVQHRAGQSPQAGRPSAASSDSIETYTLMNRTHEVLDFAFDTTNFTFYDAHRIIDPSRAPLGLVSPRKAHVSAAALSFWWRHRSIPVSRAGIEEKLQSLGLQNTAQLPFKSLGLSLSDQYWVRPKGSAIAWEDINFFNNSFAEMSEEGWLGHVGLNSPDNTSEGQLPKKWVCKRDKRILLKGAGPLTQEPYNEVVATALFKRVCPKNGYVAYEIVSLPGKTKVSSCEVFLSDDEEYIPAYYIKDVLRRPNHRNEFQHYIECCASLGVEDAEEHLSRMLVCDSILANHDRHWRNFGLIRNVETLEYRNAPLFDSGSSLWCNTDVAQLRRGDYRYDAKPFYEDANRQLRLVNDYSWLKIDNLDGFAEEAQGILRQNASLADRLPFIVDGIRYRIDRIRALL